MFFIVLFFYFLSLFLMSAFNLDILYRLSAVSNLILYLILYFSDWVFHLYNFWFDILLWFKFLLKVSIPGSWMYYNYFKVLFGKVFSSLCTIDFDVTLSLFWPCIIIYWLDHGLMKEIKYRESWCFLLAKIPTFSCHTGSIILSRMVLGFIDLFQFCV